MPKEHEVKRNLEKQGWKVYKPGWPDFVCVRGDEVLFVEAKSGKGVLSKMQRKTLQILANLYWKYTSSVEVHTDKRIRKILPNNNS